MKAIVFEGGGVLGAGQPALLKALEDRGLFQKEKYTVFVGTSVGGINALALACGMRVSQLCEMWLNFKEEEVMPKKWWSIIRKLRKNNVESFIIKNILEPLGIPSDITCSGLYKLTGNDFSCVATVLQNNRGIIFSKDWFDIPVAKAVSYTVSHPLAFPPGKLTVGSTTYNLTDGGVIQNCPVSVLIPKSRDIEEVLCVGISTPGDTTNKPIDGYVEILETIIGGMVTRNEVSSYQLAEATWGENFKLWNFQARKNYNIFDATNVPKIMEEASLIGKFGEPAPISMWISPIIKSEFIGNKVAPIGIDEGAMLVLKRKAGK